MTGEGVAEAVHRLFEGAGEMGRRMAAVDWGATPFGPVAEWPECLHTAVDVCLRSRFPMILWWGPELRVLYNDAYIPSLGDKHPEVLGRTGHEAWGEIWEEIGPSLEAVLERGEVRSAIERGGLTLTVDCPPLSDPVWVDRELWERVVLNLLSNAVKFTLQGGISMTTRSTEAGVELTVADTGVGIAAEVTSAAGSTAGARASRTGCRAP